MKFNLYCFDKARLDELKSKNSEKIKDFDNLLKKWHWYTEKKATELQSFPWFSFKIFYKNPSSNQPDWLDFVNQWLKDEKIKLNKKSVSLIILVKLNKSGIYFAITFWSAHYIIKKDNILDDFWLKTVLNSIDHKQVTLIDWKKIWSNTRETRTIFSKSTDFSYFWLDQLEELLTQLEWLPSDYTLWAKLSWKDSLWFNVSLTDFSFAKIWEQIEKYYHFYGQKTYEEHFKFIDNYRVEKNSKLIWDLNWKLVTYLLKDVNDYLDISISLPNMLDHIDVYNVQIDKIEKKVDILNEWEILPIIKTILASTKKGKIDKLKEMKVFWNHFESEKETEKFSFYNCINYECDLGDEKYILHNALWNRVSKDFLSNIEDDLNKITFITLNNSWKHISWKDTYGKDIEYWMSFKPFDWKVHFETRVDEQWKKYSLQSEWVYNIDLCRTINWILLDAKNFTDKLPWSSKIEVCDILLGKKFIHIKRWNSSSTLSHLFNQSVVSLELFRRYDKYIDFINEKIKEKTNTLWELKKIDNLEIILWIIINWNFKDKIPFFSKVTLINLYHRISSMWSSLILVQIGDITK